MLLTVSIIKPKIIRHFHFVWNSVLWFICAQGFCSATSIEFYLTWSEMLNHSFSRAGVQTLIWYITFTCGFLNKVSNSLASGLLLKRRSSSSSACKRSKRDCQTQQTFVTMLMIIDAFPRVLYCGKTSGKLITLDLTLFCVSPRKKNSFSFLEQDCFCGNLYEARVHGE